MEGNQFEFQRLQLRYRASQEDLKRERERHAADVASYEQEVRHLRRELNDARSGSSSEGRR
jgi:hypothetical protein